MQGSNLLTPNLCNTLNIHIYTPPTGSCIGGVNITNAQVSDTLKVYLIKVDV